MAEPYDVAILGATPAGCAAANVLALANRRLIVVQTGDDGARCGLLDWAGEDFFSRNMLGKAAARAAGAEDFKQVRYHSADFAHQTQSKSRTRAGWFFRTDNLVKALREAARSAGAAFWSPRGQPVIHLEEDGVRLTASKTVRARILLVAHKRPSEIVGDLSLPMRTVPQTAMAVAGLDVPLSTAVAELSDQALHVVESDEKGQLGIFFTFNGTLHLRVICQSPANSPGAELSRMITRLAGAQLLPEPLDLTRATGNAWRPPAGVALDMESHVAKRCLLIGTAGGFVETTTGQTLSSSVQSALLAASVALKALDSSNCQTELMEFENSWRSELADFIRPSNTSLQLLLPLLFNNKRIAARFTAALLNGKNI